MKKDEDIFRKFREAFGRIKGHVHLLDKPVPVECQLEYFKYSDGIRRAKSSPVSDDEECEEMWKRLTNGEAMDLDDKRYSLCFLATSKNIKAYRMLEKYAKDPDPDIADWASLALMEARMNLESDFSNEKQVFFSTGMGGKDGKFRFYCLLVSRTRESFEDYQRQVIEREITYAFSAAGCELERMTVADRYVELVILMPLETDLKLLIDRTLSECNQYGNFLDDTYVLTNVAEFSESEIQKFINEKIGND